MHAIGRIRTSDLSHRTPSQNVHGVPSSPSSRAFLRLFVRLVSFCQGLSAASGTWIGTCLQERRSSQVGSPPWSGVDAEMRARRHPRRRFKPSLSMPLFKFKSAGGQHGACVSRTHPTAPRAARNTEHVVPAVRRDTDRRFREWLSREGWPLYAPVTCVLCAAESGLALGLATGWVRRSVGTHNVSGRRFRSRRPAERAAHRGAGLAACGVVTRGRSPPMCGAAGGPSPRRSVYPARLPCPRRPSRPCALQPSPGR